MPPYIGLIVIILTTLSFLYCSLSILSHFTLMFSCLRELVSILCSLHATVTIIGSCVDKFVKNYDRLLDN
jgi:hypothetical protein